MQLAVQQHSPKFDNKTRILAFWIGGDASLQLHKPFYLTFLLFLIFFYPACLSVPTHHVLEFHFGNWLCMLHLSPAKVENSFPSLMECHSHFQREADERERSCAPPSQNRYCMAGSQGLQRCRVTPVGRRCHEMAPCKWSLTLVHKAN